MKSTDNFKIYIDRLKDGASLEINVTEDPEFLQIKEKDLAFKKPIHVKGEAYLTPGELILKLYIEAEGELPCAVCNKKTSFLIKLNNFYLAKPFQEISSHVFDYSEDVREAILLEVPFIVECSEGNCPGRKEIESFLSEPTSDEETGEGWQPFKDL